MALVVEYCMAKAVVYFNTIAIYTMVIRELESETPVLRQPSYQVLQEYTIS